MKRNVILFLISFLGILLSHYGGWYVFIFVPDRIRMIVVLFSLIMEVLFYVLSIYTLVISFRVKGGIWIKIFKIINWIFTLFLTLVFVLYLAAGINVSLRNYKYFSNKSLEKLPDTAVRAKLNPFVEYNGLSKDFILGLRTGNIDSNFIKSIDYKPNEEVWSEMFDKGLWFSIDHSVCFDKKTDCRRKTAGISSLSRIINNPLLLVAPVMVAIYHLDEKLPVCSDEGLKLIPKDVYIDSINSKIIIVYKGTAALKRCNYLQLSGLNARDFGYEWAKVTDSQNILFPYPDNISKRVYKFEDKIVVSDYCGGNGKGSANSDKKCNVLSPIDEKVMFNVTSYPANIELGLWQKKPIFIFQRPEYNVEIRFVE